MLKLFAGDEGGVLKGSSVPIRWCVTQDTMAMLKDREIENPYLLIVSVVGDREMTRQLAPLGQLMDYLQPQREGKTTVYACIVWDGDDKESNIKKRFMTKDEGAYKTDVVDEGRFDDELHNSSDLCSIEVVVPQEIFAKKPWDWTWVNWLHDTFPRDQCEFRKWRIAAYTFNPIAVVFITAFFACAFIVRVTIAGFLLLSGCVKTNLKPLVSHKLKTKEIWKPLEYETRQSYFTLTWRDSEWRPEHAFHFLVPFAPICWIALYLFLWGLTREQGFFNLTRLVATFQGLLAISLVWGVVDFLRYNHYKKLAKERRHDKPKKKSRVSWFEPELLLCDSKPLTASISNLPPKKRTFHLKFLDLKADWCKPFPK